MQHCDSWVSPLTIVTSSSSSVSAAAPAASQCHCRSGHVCEYSALKKSPLIKMRSNFPLKEVRPQFKEGSSDNFLLLVQFSIMDKIGRKIGKGVCVSVKKEYQAMIIKSQPPVYHTFCESLSAVMYRAEMTRRRTDKNGPMHSVFLLI